MTVRTARRFFTVWVTSIWTLLRVKLLTKYKVDMTLEKPKVAFRETIRKSSDVDSKYKKQSGGHGQYGHVKMRFCARWVISRFHMSLHRR